MAKSLYRKLITILTDWLTREPPPSEIPPYDYNRLKYEIRPGDVLLIEGQSRVSEVIRFITQSSWTHAALYIGRLHDIEDNNLRKIAATHLKKRENARLVIEGLLGQGIVISPLSSYRLHHIRICRPIGISPADIEQVVAYAIRALGKPYNVRQFFDLARLLLPWSILPRRWGSTLFRTPSGEPESGICSSVIAEAFLSVKFPILPFVTADKEDNVELVQRNPHLYSPKDFDISPYFEIIKYPLFDPNLVTPYYRRLPWAKEGVLHHDHGIITTPAEIHPKKKKKFMEKLLWRHDNNSSSSNDDGNDPPSTD